MSNNKKWYENVPKHGIIVINDYGKPVHYTQVDVEALKFWIKDKIDNVKIISPQEWWQFAPWQDMKDAPENTELLLLDNDGFIVPIDKISKGRVECHGDELSLLNFKGWLPLPEESQ